MVYQKSKEMNSGEHEYKCLMCDTQFVHFNSGPVQCPKCGSKDARTVVPSRELEDDEDAFRPD
jgi:Zn finger protein HypA/HybF involved in hydrogenase expression